MKSSNFVHSVGMSSIDAVRVMSPSLIITAGLPDTNVFDYLRAEMGERRYQRLEESESLKLANVYIRRNTLGRGEGAGKGLVNHDAAVVELIFKLDGQQQGTLDVLHIVAEKAMTKEQAGRITIRWMPDFRFQRAQDVKFECFNRPIRLHQVLAVLKRQSPTYDTVKANCWHYAADVVLGLVNTLQDGVEDFDNSVQNSLERTLNAAKRQVHKANTILPHSIGIGSIVAASSIVAAGIAAIVAIGVGVSRASTQEEEEEDNH